jgi:branched-subunit amino acid aminotransferase/4-amino-4-deoxychorismate lyase
MPPEGAFPVWLPELNRTPGWRARFGLIETMLWERRGGVALLPFHLARVTASAAALGLPFDAARAEQEIAAAVAAHLNADRLRVRLVARADGGMEVTAKPEPPLPPGTVWRCAIAAHRLDPESPVLRHKSTLREAYDGERARLRAQQGADEALFLNTRGEVCEGGVTSVFVERDGVLLTPPLASGLVPGVLRASLIAQGRAREAVVLPGDLAGGFFVGNAARGLIPARLAE